METTPTTELAPAATTPAAPEITLAKLTDFMNAMGLASKLTAGEKTQFIEIAQAYQLNPFTREVYAVKYGDKFSLIVGYEVYLKRAERSGKLSGWQTQFVGEGKNLSCICTIHRKDWQQPLVHEVYLAEYDQNNTMWRSKPRTMLRKVAIAQAFRMAFPVELGGIPYTSDELPDQQPVAAAVVDNRAPAPKMKKLEAAQAMKAFEETKELWLDNINACTTLDEVEQARKQLKESQMDDMLRKQLANALCEQAVDLGFTLIDTENGKVFAPRPAELLEAN